MDFWPAILNAFILLGAAFALGAICERFRQSAIIGYLLAGAILGPNALRILPSDKAVEGLAEIGVALLLFSIGLEFSWRRLRSMGTTALGGGLLQIILTLVVMGGVALTAGLELRAAVIVGAALSLSSTACVLRVLFAKALMDTLHGRYALGILLFQDIAVIPLLILANLLARPGEGGHALATIGWTLLMLVVLVVGFYLLFNHIAPRILDKAVLLRNRELPILFAVVGALGAILVAHSLDLSPAVGAFIAGMILAESPYATQVRADLAALRTLLVTLFFSSIGMLGSPSWMLENWLPLTLVVCLIIAGKTLIVWCVLRVLRQPHGPALATGLCLSQVGEFSFVVAGSARGGYLTEDAFQMLVSAMMVTLFLTPYLVTGGPSAARAVIGFLARLRLLGAGAAGAAEDEEAARRHILLVGFGPAGERASEMLRSQTMPITVLDLNPKLIEKAKERGFDANLGDASQPDVLEHARIHSAVAVLVTLPDPSAVRKIIELVRSLAPAALIVVRSRYHIHHRQLELAGATLIVDEEESVGDLLAVRFSEILGLLPSETEAASSAPGAAATEPPRGVESGAAGR